MLVKFLSLTKYTLISIWSKIFLAIKYIFSSIPDKYKMYMVYMFIILFTFLFFAYTITGLRYFNTDTFCAKVNVTAVNRDSINNSTVSLVKEGETIARGYDIKNVYKPPFVWITGSFERKSNLVFGETYLFTARGTRVKFLKMNPVISKFSSNDQCEAQS